MVKKLWNDPVWSKVIAGVILAAGATIGAYFLNWWPNIGRFIKKGYELAFLSTNVPNWLLGLMSILSLPVILIAAALIWEKIHPKETKKGPEWLSYRSDIYFNLRWRWNYFEDGNIFDLHTFCPHCDFQVFPHNASSFRMIDRIGFRCDSCGRNLGEMDESPDSLQNKVKRFIQQKLRNGFWARQNAV